MTSRKIPAELATSMRKIVFRKADEICYLSQDRVRNRHFLTALQDDCEVGVVLAEYMPKAEVRTYIKDGILNKYSKLKSKKAFDDIGDLSEVLKAHYGKLAELIEERQRVSLWKLHGHGWLITSVGNFAKWETAIKSAVQFIAKSPGLHALQGPKHQKEKVNILLLICVPKSEALASDLAFMKKSVGYIGIDVKFIT